VDNYLLLENLCRADAYGVVACFCHAWRVDPAKRARNRNKKWTGLFSKYNFTKLKIKKIHIYAI
jgi:hypothetical protein